MITNFKIFLNENVTTLNKDKLRYLRLSMEHNHSIEHIEELLDGTGHYTALRLACEYGRLDVLNWLLDYFHEKNPLYNPLETQNAECLILAIKNQKYNIIDRILVYDANLMDSLGWNSILTAAKNEDEKMIKYLVDFEKKYGLVSLERFSSLFSTRKINKKTMKYLEPLFRYFDEIGKVDHKHILPLLKSFNEWTVANLPKWFNDEWMWLVEVDAYNTNQ